MICIQIREKKKHETNIPFRALAELKSVGLTYPGLRQDRVWVHEGQVNVRRDDVLG